MQLHINLLVGGLWGQIAPLLLFRLIHLSPRDVGVGCLRHSLDSPEIQFTDGERVPDFAQINSEVLFRLTKLYSLNILNGQCASKKTVKGNINENNGRVFKIIDNLINLKYVYIHSKFYTLVYKESTLILFNTTALKGDDIRNVKWRTKSSKTR